MSYTPIFIHFSPKLAKLVFWGGSGGYGRVVGGVRGVESKSNYGFELCCPFLTSTPSFIQIGPKLAKLVLWGGLGGWG